jgi:hypothetical protein
MLKNIIKGGVKDKDPAERYRAQHMHRPNPHESSADKHNNNEPSKPIPRTVHLPEPRANARNLPREYSDKIPPVTNKVPPGPNDHKLQQSQTHKITHSPHAQRP